MVSDKENASEKEAYVQEIPNQASSRSVVILINLML